MKEVFPTLTSFYNAIATDPRIGSTHISVYFALLQQWNVSGGYNPFSIVRCEIMQAAKISSRSTYNRCINDLKDFGYISYQPSANKSRRSIIYLKLVQAGFELDTSVIRKQ